MGSPPPLVSASPARPLSPPSAEEEEEGGARSRRACPAESIKWRVWLFSWSIPTSISRLAANHWRCAAAVSLSPPSKVRVMWDNSLYPWDFEWKLADGHNQRATENNRTNVCNASRSVARAKDDVVTRPSYIGRYTSRYCSAVGL